MKIRGKKGGQGTREEGVDGICVGAAAIGGGGGEGVGCVR